jgi:chorismate mutase
MNIVEDIGHYKVKNNISIFQLKRWLDIIQTRKEFGKVIGLDPKFTERLLQLVHRESINLQSEIMNKNKENDV